MKKTLSGMIFMISTASCLSGPIDWENFNSGLIIEVTRPNGTFTCSGVAINKNTVLTAAHCLDGNVLSVRIFNQIAYDPTAPFWDGSNFKIHPKYDIKKSNYVADIAKIKLSKDLPETINFFPIIKNPKNLTGKILRIGFGGRENKNIRTLITPELERIHLEQEMLELKDQYSYSGDSGGPIFIQNQGQMYLVALHSTLSFGPEGKNSYNPLLSNHRSWIEN